MSTFSLIGKPENKSSYSGALYKGVVVFSVSSWILSLFYTDMKLNWYYIIVDHYILVNGTASEITQFPLSIWAFKDVFYLYIEKMHWINTFKSLW
jgi:hypothetical protein